MIQWYLKVVRDNYANFEGRARRSEYWYFILVNILISIVLRLIDYAIDSEVGVVGLIYSLAVLVPSLAVGVRRLHDIGKSGWMILLLFLPFIGWIWLIVLYCTEGTPGPNEYGPDPKNDYNEFDQIGNNEPY